MSVRKFFLNLTSRAQCGLKVTAFDLSLGLAGCAGPQISTLDQNTYRVSDRDTAGIFGNANRMEENVRIKANEFAASQGKILVPIREQRTPMAVGQFAAYALEF